MENPKIVARYYGVNIIKSCGYFYPEVNGDIECKSIKEVKEWLEDIWLFYTKNLAYIKTVNLIIE